MTNKKILQIFLTGARMRFEREIGKMSTDDILIIRRGTYDNIHEKLFWRFFKACDKNIDLILEINIF